MTHPLRWRAIGPAAAALLSAPAAGQAPPSYGLDFVTVGAPGNRVPNQAEAPNFYAWNYSPIPGRVDYEFRIMRTEVNVTQWFEFVQAFAPYWQGAPNSRALTSDWIFYTPSGHFIAPGTEKYSANMSWFNAARYANWLHNGKVNEAWAFETGAYGLSEPVPARSPEARFWIPSLDEWIKAVYYDPDRYGPNAQGYWKHPGSGDDVLIPGYPSEGGETNAGLWAQTAPPRPLRAGEMDVGSYPHVTTPWGLLDASGGVRGWADDVIPDSELRIRLGSHAGVDPAFWDRIDLGILTTTPALSPAGLRIGSVIPSPGVLPPLVTGAFGIALRRRRTR